MIETPDTGTAALYSGLVLQHRGTTIGDVYAARSAIEPSAVRMLAANATPEDVQALRDALAEEEAALPDPEATARTGTRFHALVVELSGNQTLHLFHQMVVGILEKHTLDVVSRDAEGDGHPSPASRRGHAVHGRFTDLVETHEVDAAVALWTSHLHGIDTVLGSPDATTPLDLFPGAGSR